MTPKKPAKKNVSIEVRLSDETKSAFMERCRDQGRTASEAIRLFISDQVEVQTAPSRRAFRHGRIVVAGLAGTVLGFGVAAPSVARSTPDPRIVCQQFDRNHDGAIGHHGLNAR